MNIYNEIDLWLQNKHKYVPGVYNFAIQNTINIIVEPLVNKLGQSE